MKISQIVLITLLTPTIVQICLFMLPKKDHNSTHCVCMPRYLRVISVVTGVLGAVLGVIAWWKGKDIYIAIAVCMGVVSCAFLMMFKSLRIIYDSIGFTVKQLLRHAKRFSYADIDSVTSGHSPLQFTLYIKKKKIFVDRLATGQLQFYEYAEKKYREVTGESAIPHKESCLFHGYVQNPGEIAFFPCLVFFLCIAAAVFGTVISLNMLDTPKELLWKNVQITSWSKERDVICLKTTDGELRAGQNEVPDFEALQKGIEHQQIFSALVEPNKEGDGAIGKLWGLQDHEGNSLILKETVAANNRRNAIEIMVFLWGMAIIYGLLLYAGYYILCHAPAHPRLASLLIKKEYRNF